MTGAGIYTGSRVPLAMYRRCSKCGGSGVVR